MAEDLEKTQPKLIELIKPDMHEEELKGLVTQFISPEEEEILGGKEEAIQRITDATAYVGVFAPVPATFDLAAFSAVNARGLTEEQTNKVLEICKRMGVIEDVEGRPGRMAVSREMVEIAKNQFLT